MRHQRPARALVTAALATAFAVGTVAAEAGTLKGSRKSLLRQRKVARQNDFSYLRNRGDVQKFVSLGLLQRVPGNSDYELAGVSYPYARPEVKLFVERLGRQHRQACGEKLVVTSLVRPVSRQPRNASPLSVHPTGMALDLRMSRTRGCRKWLESTLLSLERSGILDATRERRPPHYHVALFPERYARYVDRKLDPAAPRTYTVSRGDTLWDIARRVGTTVATIKQLNGIRGTRIVAGQSLQLP